MSRSKRPARSPVMDRPDVRRQIFRHCKRDDNHETSNYQACKSDFRVGVFDWRKDVARAAKHFPCLSREVNGGAVWGGGGYLWKTSALTTRGRRAG
jgi:hypothetical protein